MLEEAEGINIKKIGVPDIIRPLAAPFDPVRDITEQDWKQVKDKREQSYRLQNYGQVLTDLFYLKMVSPARFHEYQDNYPHAASFQWYVMDRGDLKDPFDSDAMAFAYYVFSGQYDVRERVKDHWGNMEELLKKSPGGGWDEIIILRNLFNVQTLFPEKAGEWRAKIPHDEIMKKLVEFKNIGEWVKYCQVAGLYKLLFPERASQIQTTQEDWGAIRKSISVNGFDLKNAYYLTLLGADNLKLTQQELTYTPALPAKVTAVSSMPVLKAA